TLVIGRSPPNVVPHAGVLDLDDVGAEVGEEQRAEAARQQAAEVEDADAVERELARAARPVHAATRRGTPRISRASATVAARRPMSSVGWRAWAMRSPLERAMVPSGR